MNAAAAPAVPPRSADASPPRPPKLLDQVQATARARHFNSHTAELYRGWIRRFILFHNKRHPAELGASEVAQFLTHLAVTEHVTVSVQSQARAALVFLYRHVLEKPLPPLEGVVRPTRSAKPPTT